MDNKIRLFDKKNVDELEWNEFQNGPGLQAYYGDLIRMGTKIYCKNLDVDCAVLALKDELIPLAFGKSAPQQSYVASNIGQYINYPIDELKKLNIVKGPLKWLSILILNILGLLSRSCNFDKAIFINCYLTSSTIWDDIDKEELRSILDFFHYNYPDRTLVFKGIDPLCNPHLFNALSNLNCMNVFSRELYILDPQKTKLNRKRPFVQDRKLAEKSAHSLQWQLKSRLSQNEKESLLKYYLDLYLGKYSDFNPNYTINYLDLINNSDIFQFGCIYENGRLKAAEIIMTKNEVTLTPFIGYDRSEPKEKGLYRLLNYYISKYALDEKLIFNMSSGAGKFKSQRGGKVNIEYNMVHFNKTGFARQLPWKIFKLLGDMVLIPQLKKLNL